MRRAGSLLLASSTLVAAAAVHAAHAEAASHPSGAGVFGVALGAPGSELDATLASLRLACHRPGAAPAAGPSDPAAAQAPPSWIICGGSPRRTPVPVVTTFWLSRGRVQRVYQQAQVTYPGYAQYLAAARLLRDHVEAGLGRRAESVVDPLPPWARGLDDVARRRALAEGRLGMELRWSLGDAAVSLRLRGEGGAPTLVLALEPAGQAAAPQPQSSPQPQPQPQQQPLPSPLPPPPPLPPADALVCTAEELAVALTGLFPPAPAGVRVDSAGILSRCRDPRTAGALRAALAYEPEVRVQMQLVRALVDAGDVAPARALLADPRAPDPLRAAALGALAARDLAPPPAALTEIAALPGPALSAAIASHARRMAAAAPASPPGSAGPSPPAPPAGTMPPSAATPSPGLPATPPVIAGGATAGAAPPPLVLPPRRLPPAPPPPPPKPWTERDGTALAITTSVAAGGLWGGGLSLLAQQDGVGVVTLLGSAGAVIGGGTAWGLTRFGLRPSAAQALWFANSTAWGALAGLTIWSGSGSDSDKLKYGLLVGGETAGILAGAWSAHRYSFTPGQTVFADSLVLGAGLGLVGGSVMLDPGGPWEVPPAAAIGVVPALLGAAVASRHVRIGEGDAALLALAPALAGWTGTALAAGGYRVPLLGGGLDSARAGGGFMLGAGAGYLGAAAAASFVELSPRRLGLTTAGVVAGNALGLGLHMTGDPGDDLRWPLGAGLGGLALGTAAFAAEPHFHPGPRAPSMTIAGALYGGGTWALALAAGADGQEADARLPGGMLAGGVGLGIAGLMASQWWQPDGYDQGVAAAGTALGMGAGLGAGKLVTPDARRGVPEVAGVLGGAAAGFAGGVLVARGPRLRPPALLAAPLGGGYGFMVGTLVPTLGDDAWSGGRTTAGAGWLGTSLGAAGAALAARATDAGGGQVALAGGAGALGLGLGAGLGWLSPAAGSRPARIGALAGSTALLGGALLAERRLQLSQALGPHSVGLAGFAGGVGALHGLLAAAVVEPDRNGPVATRQRGGAALAGASAGVATGLVASKWWRPTALDYAGTAGASLLGHSAGLGVAQLALDDPGGAPDRREPTLRLGGALAGLGAGAAFGALASWRAPDLAAGTVGAGYGALLGTLAPSLGDEDWRGGRRASGGAHLGLAIGGAGAAAAAHLTGASSDAITVPTFAAGLGAATGLGAGLLYPADPGERTSQPPRVATFAGTLAYAAAAMALDRPLRLREGFRVPGTAGLALVGAGIGAGEGLLLAALLDPSGGGTISGAPDDQAFGGFLLGSLAGGTSGFLLARAIQPTALDRVVAVGGAGLGGGLGLGLSMSISDDGGRPDSAATMAGSLAGLGAAALVQRHDPLVSADFLAAPVGGAFGGLFGRILPTLDDARWGPRDRAAGGGLLAGITGGTLAAIALRHGTGASPRTIGLTTLGGIDGAMTGLGVGLLLDEPGTSQAQRIGVLAGGLGGLGVGAALWPRLSLRGTDATMVVTLSALGAWNGLLLPQLGHARDEASTREQAGGALAGVGAGSLLGTALVPALDLDGDLIANALAMDLVFTGAGAGAAALASERADAASWGMLGGGAAGLVLGAALHRQIEVGAGQRPLLALASVEGLWLGGWLPYVLHDRAQVSDRQRIGALAAGGLGALGLATLASPALAMDADTAGTAALGSAVGASLAGGSALLANDLHGRGGVGLMLGGTGAGLLAGALAAPALDTRAGVGYAAVGTALGASEALVFAWAGRADGGADYAGAALVGAGLGSGIGLAAAANPGWLEGRGLPVAGFAGWGAWMGAFGGSLYNRDPHEVTLGGLAGANAGVLAGAALLHTGAVEPRDFGWLSAFGAAGTVVGGGVGALFSTSTNPRPALAGLLVGPALGLTTGALVLPHLRNVGLASAPRSPAATTTSSVERRRPSPAGTTTTAGAQVAGATTATDDDADQITDLDEDRRRRRARPPLAQRLRRMVHVSHVMPVVGALPATAEAGAGPPPFVLGIAGLWR